MDRDQLVNYIGALDDAEWSQLVDEARGVDNSTDAKLRAAEKAGDWQTSFAIKSRQLSQLLNPNQKDR